jgi:hypothetical protein
VEMKLRIVGNKTSRWTNLDVLRNPHQKEDKIVNIKKSGGQVEKFPAFQKT